MELLYKVIVWFFKRLGLGDSQKVDKSSCIEVERKYRLSPEEFDSMPGLSESSGFRFQHKQDMTDTFVPAALDSEMIRIRDIASEGKETSVLTLKKWIEVDGERVRQERETESLDPVARGCILEMGSRLAKDALLTFSKERVEYQARKDGNTVTIALDEVHGLGAFSGPYLEVEVLASRPEDVKQALQTVEKIAFDLLGESRETTPSYREMLLSSRSKNS